MDFRCDSFEEGRVEGRVVREEWRCPSGVFDLQSVPGFEHLSSACLSPRTMAEDQSSTANAQAGNSRLDATLQASSSTFTRPPFRPVAQPTSPCILSSTTSKWTTPFTIPVHFLRPHFFSGLKDLALHPERNSSLILRADPLPPRDDPEPDEETQRLGMARVEEVRLRLMPKQVGIDGRLNQRVAFYEDEQGRGVVIMVPEAKVVDDVPFYHPPVRKLAFIYEPIEDENGEEAGEVPIRGTLSVSYLPFAELDVPETSTVASMPELEVDKPAFLGPRPARAPRKRSPLAPTTASTSSDNSGKPAGVAPSKQDPLAIHQRTTRTCRLILERIYKHAYGVMMGYQKRVLHDVRLPALSLNVPV